MGFRLRHIVIVIVNRHLRVSVDDWPVECNIIIYHPPTKFSQVSIILSKEVGVGWVVGLLVGILYLPLQVPPPPTPTYPLPTPYLPTPSTYPLQ